jgi:hypothetical protein
MVFGVIWGPHICEFAGLHLASLKPWSSTMTECLLTYIRAG